MIFFGGWIRSDVSGEVRLIIQRTTDNYTTTFPSTTTFLMRAAEAGPMLRWVRMNIQEYLRK